MAFRIGVDGGGTTTRAALIDEKYVVVSRAQSGSSNLYNLGIEAATQNIRAAVEAALVKADIDAGQIASFGFGLAGVVGAREKSRWQAALQTCYGENVVVDEDVAAALVGAFGPDELRRGGAVLIAGTGANCFGQNAAGKRSRADGWGPLLGDRGSGYWLGERAIRAAVAASDGAGPKTLLQTLLLHHFEVENLDALVGVVYAGDFRRDRIAAFVPHVLRAAREGDAVASGLLREAGECLGATAQAVLQALGISRLALTGGLLEHSEEVRRVLDELLSPPNPQTPIVTHAPRFEPVVGAALLPLVIR